VPVVDSHCHLADEAFSGDLTDVVARATAAGVGRVLCILSADDVEEVARARRVADAWPAVAFSAAIHPHRAGAYAGRAAEGAAVTRQTVAAVRARAVGEIGLDYHYDFSPRDVQREVFAAHVGLAVELDRPVVIHTREATADTIAVLREAGAGRVRGVMHCFSGGTDEARLGLDLGFFISFAGILTFPKAGALRETAKYVPRDRLLIETDAPFLAPVPHRGKRNEPAWVVETLAILASATSTPVTALADQIATNFDAFVGPPTA
jgi:TatD DNase family protein